MLIIKFKGGLQEMGLASLIKVAQGKNAENVSFEDKFLKLYNEAVMREAERTAQPVPTEYFRPSSMGGCKRMLYFMRTQAEQDKEERSVQLEEICNSGTDRHLRIQKLLEDIPELKLYDLEQVVKEANLKGINTEFMGWNTDHTEARCKNEDLSLFFQPDGVGRFMNKEIVIEIKTESTYQFNMRYEPKPEHLIQATCYAMGLGMDYILFFYEDRNFLAHKPYLVKVTDEMRQEVIDKINSVNASIKAGIPPEKEEDKCTYCSYKETCKRADIPKNEPEPSKEPKKEPKARNTKAKTEKALKNEHTSSGGQSKKGGTVRVESVTEIQRDKNHLGEEPKKKSKADKKAEKEHKEFEQMMKEEAHRFG